jgi:hypothetical protein
MRKVWVAPITLTALASGVLMPQSAMAAGSSGSRCAPDPGYSVSQVSSSFIRDPSKTVYGHPGVTLTVSVAKGHTWTGTITGTAKGQYGAIVVSAELSVSASISYARTTTVTLGGSWKVPKSQRLGWLALGSEGYRMRWTHGSHLGAACHWVVDDSGTARLPARAPVIGHS